MTLTRSPRRICVRLPAPPLANDVTLTAPRSDEPASDDVTPRLSTTEQRFEYVDRDDKTGPLRAGQR